MAESLRTEAVTPDFLFTPNIDRQFFWEFQQFFVEQFWISPIDPFNEYRIRNSAPEP